jgi:glycine/D-amino acid oxidase-like deaminating enzyme
MRFAVIGSGFTGSIIAHELAKIGYKLIYMKKDHM